MPDLILHHYDLSPYSEKVRLMFGLKGLAWRSVRIPVVMPKPDYTELTGGYRRTPSLQIGADVYCDSKACAQVLERLHPAPSFFPDGDPATVWGAARGAETGFMMAVFIFLGAGGVFDEAFIEDRKQMAPALDLERIRAIVPAKRLQLAQNLERLERQLSDGRAFLLGPAPSLADLAAYHTTKFLEFHPLTAPELTSRPQLGKWLARVAAIGHGARSEIASDEAIAVARDAAPEPWTGDSAPLPDGLALGDRVLVVPEEVGSGNVPGELVASPPDEIAIRRSGPRCGEVVVHFPREDYLVVRAG